MTLLFKSGEKVRVKVDCYRRVNSKCHSLIMTSRCDVHVGDESTFTVENGVFTTRYLESAEKLKSEKVIDILNKKIL